jgi:hypothetical protein
MPRFSFNVTETKKLMIKLRTNKTVISTDKSILNRLIFVAIFVFVRVLQSETYYSDNRDNHYNSIHRNLPYLNYTKNNNINITMRI